MMAQSDVTSFDRYGYYDTLFQNPTPPFGEVDTLLYLQNQKAGAASVHGWAGNVNVAQGLGPDGNAPVPTQPETNRSRFPPPSSRAVPVSDGSAWR